MVAIQPMPSWRRRSPTTKPAGCPSSIAFRRTVSGNVNAARTSIHGHELSGKHSFSSSHTARRSRQVAGTTATGATVWCSAAKGVDYSLALRKFVNRLVNSIGKMYLVEAPAPMALSVSKYCSVMVFWSTVLAAVKIFSSAAA